jgi:outer membrane protein assembly factor BamA
VRGYDQNIRNGNAYAVFNSELRIPVFTYLLNKPLKAEFLRNLQLVGFFDAGTAWEGLSPFEQDNPYNTVTFGQSPLSVDVNFFRDPVVAGTGLGLRTTIFGYFIRIDRARGIELNGLTDPSWYISLSLDF